MYPRGQIKYRILNEIYPSVENQRVFILKITGKILKELLENGVSKWPAFDGRWCCVSGLKFSFDPKAKEGNRIISESLRTAKDEPIDPEKYYSIASSWFI